MSCHSGATNVSAWTPLVMWSIGFSSGGTCGQRSRSISEDTPPWMRDTPFWYRLPRTASAVMLKSWLCGVRPSARSSCGVTPTARQ